VPIAGGGYIAVELPIFHGLGAHVVQVYPTFPARLRRRRAQPRDGDEEARHRAPSHHEVIERAGASLRALLDD
jgi:hypothetical protein